MADRHREQIAAYDRLTSHPHWDYRACAPDPDNPEVTAADPDVPIGVWLTPDQESQKTRPARERQALALCAACPVRTACLTYALSYETGRKNQDIWGGMTAEQRKAVLLAHKTAQTTPRQAPAGPSPLDLRVLHALAAHRAPTAVARAAGLTVTRANWHRSKLVTAHGLDPATTTRAQLLYAARRAGHLPPTIVIVADRGITAAIPSRQDTVEAAHALPGLQTRADVRRLTDNRQDPAPHATASDTTDTDAGVLAAAA